MSARKPNFLIIMTDQQRWDTVGAVKPANLKTPTLDRLFGEGYSFTNAYCQGPVCIPSRASFLTGKYVHQHRLFHNNCSLPDYETTWAEVLAENGYATVSVGRTHTINKGFEHIPVPNGDSYPDDYPADMYNPDRRGIYQGAKERYVEYRRAQMACDTVEHMLEGNEERPFAMFLGFVAPHDPYVLPAALENMYRDEDFPEPRLFSEDTALPGYWNSDNFYNKVKAANLREAIRYYYTMVSMIDECVGMVIDRLETLGVLEDTIVIFTSDHGEMLGDHRRWAKSCIYDASVKVPFIMRNPKRIPQGESSALIESVDLFPTILDYAGIELPNAPWRLPGRSLRSLAEGREVKIKDAVFAELPQWIMLRTEDWKIGYGYTERVDDTNTPKEHDGILFDVKHDPDESRNLFNDPDHRDVVSQLMQHIVDFYLTVRVPLHKDVTQIAFEHHPAYPPISCY